MAFQDAYASQADKFAVIAFHDKAANSLKEMDEKISSTASNYWRGRHLPFPILIDPLGTTVTKYGVRAFPTTLLIDPQCNLVGHDYGQEKLASMLTPLSAEKQLEYLLNKRTSIGFGKTSTLKDTVRWFFPVTKIPIDIDDVSEADQVREFGVDFNMAITHKSVIEYLFNEAGYGIKSENGKLKVVKGAGVTMRSKDQFYSSKRWRELMAKPKRGQFEGTLEDFVEYLNRDFPGTITLGIADVQRSNIKSDRKIHWDSKNEPLGVSLNRALKTHGLVWTTEYEMVIIRKK